MTRLIQELLENDNQLQIINGEVEKVINRREKVIKMLQDTDLIELFDSGDASGQRGATEDLSSSRGLGLGAQLHTHVRGKRKRVRWQASLGHQHH